MGRTMPHDHRSRLAHAADEARAAGVDAVVIAPSPDMIYLIGYDPPPLERLTALVLRPGSDPVLLVPRLERPRADASPAGGLLDMVTWKDGRHTGAKPGRALRGPGWDGRRATPP